MKLWVGIFYTLPKRLECRKRRHIFLEGSRMLRRTVGEVSEMKIKLEKFQGVRGHSAMSGPVRELRSDY